uniref:Uncharacterized protein n=1 Tax=Anguilla anguilla TaxID=7936 RepID=A0A0E9XMR2_ANGAN
MRSHLLNQAFSKNFESDIYKICHILKCTCIYC